MSSALMLSSILCDPLNVTEIVVIICLTTASVGVLGYI